MQRLRFRPGTKTSRLAPHMGTTGESKPEVISSRPDRTWKRYEQAPAGHKGQQASADAAPPPDYSGRIAKAGTRQKEVSQIRLWRRAIPKNQPFEFFSPNGHFCLIGSVRSVSYVV